MTLHLGSVWSINSGTRDLRNLHHCNLGQGKSNYTPTFRGSLHIYSVRHAPLHLHLYGKEIMTDIPSRSAGLDRRNSTLSDSLSEARNSIRSSTDDLFLPRVSKDRDSLEESHWHSSPLGLALLPAIAGIFFQNGSSIVTDVTLLVLAAIFLNWSVRLPW